MAVPILRQADYLIASVQPGFSDEDWLSLRDTLAKQVGTFRIRGVVVDVSLLDLVESFAAQTLATNPSTSRHRRAETMVVGVQPEVAFAMAQLGLILPDVPTALDLDEALARLEHQRSDGRSPPRG
jgi:rsbT antagonist protein RsbS